MTTTSVTVGLSHGDPIHPEMARDLYTVRAYKTKEVALLLGCKISWLETWVTKGLIPHQRSGALRGVWFTYDDMIATGRMMPSLMTPRQANSRAEERPLNVGAADASSDTAASFGDRNTRDTGFACTSSVASASPVSSETGEESCASSGSQDREPRASDVADAAAALARFRALSAIGRD